MRVAAPSQRDLCSSLLILRNHPLVAEEGCPRWHVSDVRDYAYCEVVPALDKPPGRAGLQHDQRRRLSPTRGEGGGAPGGGGSPGAIHLL